MKKYGNNMKLRMKSFIFFVLISFPLYFYQAWAKEVTLQLDRTEIELGDIINMKIIADFQSYTSQPDFSILNDQFDVLGTQRSNNVQIVNGKYSSTTQWLLQLTPKQAGELRIPSFEIDGARSKPQKVMVGEAKAYPSNVKGTSFIESEVNKKEVFIQEEVIYTLRFYHLGNLIAGNLRPPQFPDSLVKQLRNQFIYRKQINGRTYEVFEWSYAFYPQKSGVLSISEQDFSGRIQINGRLKSIKKTTAPLKIQVKPKPVNYPKNKAWLPANNLSFTEEWQPEKTSQNPLRVGDSITRTLTLNAEGQLQSQLPELQFKNQNGFQIYPDKPHTEESLTPQGLTSIKRYKMAIVPTKSGKITLPEVAINWWNNHTQRVETATLAAKTFTILPALNQNSLSPIKHDTLTAGKTQETHTSTIEGAQTFNYWIFVSAVFAGLWLITIWFYFRKPKQVIKDDHVDSNSHLKTAENLPATKISLKICDEVLATKNPQAFYQAWQQLKADEPILTKAITQNPDFNHLLTQLNAHLYHGEDLPENTLLEICQWIKQTDSEESHAKTQQKQLKPLYP